jgi:hypothetical protein
MSSLLQNVVTSKYEGLDFCAKFLVPFFINNFWIVQFITAYLIKTSCSFSSQYLPSKVFRQNAEFVNPKVKLFMNFCILSHIFSTLSLKLRNVQVTKSMLNEGKG